MKQRTGAPNPGGLRFGGVDLNGLFRGKRMPHGGLKKLVSEGARMPLSALNLDLWGADIEGSPLLFDSGDADGCLRAVVDSPMPMPWLSGGAEMLLMAMEADDGTPFAGDPVHALRALQARLAARGLRAVAATELEFFLLDTSGGQIRPPLIPGTDRRLSGEDILSLDTLDAFDAFFTDLYEGAEAMGIPAQAAISESGVGQFEVNLDHGDAFEVAQATWAFRLLTKGMAHKHGMTASFAAKPLPDEAGNGLHLHLSILDQSGQNIFDDGGPQGQPALRHAIAGCLKAMAPSTLVFAPHAQSYARFAPESHAPTGLAWAYENRTAAIRVPGGSPKARRIEHRVAGGDANPFLMMTAVLGAVLQGLEAGQDPPPPLEGNAYDQELPQIPHTWEAAQKAFQESPQIAGIFPPQLIDNLLRCKAQEQAKSAALDPADLHFQTVARL